MTVREFVEQTTALLSSENGTARLDAELLVSHVLKKSRAWITAHDDTGLTRQQETHLATLVARRYTHEPMAYILQYQEFYGRDFFVDKRVLVPRPESETMIELLLKHIPELRNPNSEIRIVDIGTGSGALIITAALEITSLLSSNTSFFGIDSDQDCLDVAEINARQHNVSITFLKSNLLEKVNSSHFPLSTSLVILANLPYVPDDFTVNLAALSEPHQAIFGGADGLDLYRRLFELLTSNEHRYSLVMDITLFTESLPFQHDALAKIAYEHHFTLVQTHDFIQLFTKRY